ncbi:sensor histidine kinase [Glycomyces tritici]|uniref:histidine kinase n=1 Tax=Glycomyces tritici TaxID=2665176 RepID=A0ABT7YWF1_9ACTN|nr:histidine kinase [Glycomyces tritici]MDN3242955.1 histidine kinase [Glycomyces tritici]
MAESRKPRPVEVASLVGGVSVLTALTLWSRTGLGPLDFAVAALGVGAALVQVWRPVTGALGATVLAVLSPVATPAATVGALQAAWCGRFRTAAAIAGAGVLAHLLQWVRYPNPALGFDWWAMLCVVSYGALLGWGALANSRRRLLISLHERAERAEAEQGRRIAEARAAERRALARDMHDVLANRLSLVATHAGALEFRPDAPPEKVAMAAGVVRAGVQQALEELRQVIGLLREGDEAGAGGPVAVADFEKLVEESRAAGQPVEVSSGLPAGVLPPSIGRTAFRVLQEGLTNARKHAAGEPVELALRGEPGAGLIVELTNPVPAHGGPPAVPGGGVGLVGLTERVRLAGGELDHGRSGERFRLRARLPWPT